MDAKELRIGNWVQHNDIPSSSEFPGTIFQWDTAHWFDVERSHLSLASIEPIPLTPSILEQAGTVEGRCFYTKHETKHNVTFVIWANYDGEYYFQTSTHNIHVKYVHQLQNLYFALTGEELSISFNQK